MRRFLIWSVLAVLVGGLLSGVGVWAYDRFYARFQPVAITRDPGQIQRLLDEAPWLSDGSGSHPVYIVGTRGNVATVKWLTSQSGEFRSAGFETRTILIATPDQDGRAGSSAAERATIAELWLARDHDLYRAWMATPMQGWTAAGIAPADGDLARTAVVEGSRRFYDRLTALLGDAGLGRADFPVIVWRDPQGFLKACACSDERSWAFVRDDLGLASLNAAPATPQSEAEPPETAPSPTASDDRYTGPSYPGLSAPPPVETPQGSVVPPSVAPPSVMMPDRSIPAPVAPGRATAPLVPDGPQTQRPAQRPVPAPSTRPRTAPPTSKPDDTLFF